MNSEFPPSTPPNDKAKYRQFLIDHELDPNLDTEDLRRAVSEKSDAERAQLQTHWKGFVANVMTPPNRAARRGASRV